MPTYQVYGVRVRSDIQLPCPALCMHGRADAELRQESTSVFSRASRAAGLPLKEARWFEHAGLPDGSLYLRWSGLFEFLLAPDGRKIAWHPLAATSFEVVWTYLLGQVLSFAQLKRGIESLHSTAVAVDGGAVGFVGDCGYGKSSIGAAFLQAGYRLLTDDLLVVKEEDRGFIAPPGPSRIKLFPEVAKRLLGEGIRGTPMNHLTPKLIVPLTRNQVCAGPVPLRAIYVLEPPAPRGPRITIRPLSGRAAFLQMIKHTFNPVIVEPERLRRQFDVAGRLASQVPIKSLSYPRSLGRLRAVREAIESDLAA